MTCDMDNWVMLKDAGKVVRPEFHIIASYAEMHTTEDDFRRGEIGRRMLVWSKTNLGAYKDLPSLLKAVAGPIGAPDDPKLWGVWDDGVIGCSFHVDEENSEASQFELNAWKKGELRLWAAEMRINVAFSRIYTPDESAMKKILRLQSH